MAPLKKIFRQLLFIALLFSMFNCTDSDDSMTIADGSVITKENVILKNSELFSLLEKVTTEGTSPLDEIVCIDFIYPFKLNIYNNNLVIIGTKFLTSDTQFSSFLELLPENQSLSISYPISTTLADGTIFKVNNNSELKLAIDSCSREDILLYCNGSFCSSETITPCVWNVHFTENGNNKYVSGTFFIKNNNSLIFRFNDINYVGNWFFLFINDELHININLEGMSEVAQNWNIDRKIEFVNNSIIIKDLPKNIVLEKSCEEATEYNIGDEGPAGGIVFYDKGFYSLGWRYMEMAPVDLGFLEWGCSNSVIENARHNAIGKGLYNTAAIANYHDNLINYYFNPAICSNLNNGTVVSKNALLYTIGENKDWFLPSLDELELVYSNLYLEGIGNLTNSTYWSSSEIDGGTVNTINFTTGATQIETKIPMINNIKARAVRYF